MTDPRPLATPRPQGRRDTTEAEASLRRRLRFEGDCRYVFDRIGARVARGSSVHRIPERLVVTAFDLLESVRAGRLVPAPGNPRTVVGHAACRLPQHPRYLGYWLDSARRVLVGMELGVDLIRSGKAYYVLEINLGTGLVKRRASLYQNEVDPIVGGVVDFARQRGFPRVRAFRSVWPAGYPDDFRQAGRRAGVEAVAVDPTGTGGGPDSRMVALPDPPEPGTMYVVFSSRHTTVDHFVHDKGCTTTWLPEHLPEGSMPPVHSVPTYSTPFVPDPLADSRWPDLVVKLASWDRGDFVRFVKLRPGADVLAQLAMESPTDWPRVLRMGALKRVYSRALARDRVLYQPFLPPSLSARGRLTRFRMHMLVTPLGSTFLSVHTAEAACPPPVDLPFGPVEDPRPFLVSHSGGGTYGPSDPATEADLRKVASVLGDALHRAVCATFETGS